MTHFAPQRVLNMDYWLAVHSKNVVAGDVVRVRSSAYRGELGKIHNGRLCKVLEARDGDIIVCSIDEMLPYLSRTHHAPHTLEKRVVE